MTPLTWPWLSYPYVSFVVKENGPNVPRETRWFELIGPDGSTATEQLLQAAEAHRVEVTLEKGEVFLQIIIGTT